jgi:acyl-CoA synthetase (AMP-forming)/AMP-acid ligase II
MEKSLLFRDSNQKWECFYPEWAGRPELDNTDADGWFDTGNLARMDAEGYIRIAGRSKDIIIRGGENIPVVEVEGLLFKHPTIAALAIVGYPDTRLGERACAFVAPRDGASLSFAEMVAYLKAQQMAQQYIPERLELVTELPRTPSGKVQKFKLREISCRADFKSGARTTSVPQRIPPQLMIKTAKGITDAERAPAIRGSTTFEFVGLMHRLATNLAQTHPIKRLFASS